MIKLSFNIDSLPNIHENEIPSIIFLPFNSNTPTGKRDYYTCN